MDLQALAVADPVVGRSCSCSCCSPTTAWRRFVKRKLEHAEGDAVVTLVSANEDGGLARVEVENEVAALRETVASQQETIQELCAELDEERNASASATNEAMSMILRLQREKAELQMEARQFKRFAEEQMAHDQEELAALEDFVFKRDEAIQSLSLQLQACRHQLLSHGIDPDAVSPSSVTESSPSPVPGSLPEDDAAQDGELPQTPQFEDVPIYEYPPLKCTVPEPDDHSHVEAAVDLEKYAFGETPLSEEKVENSEARIFNLEETTMASGSSTTEKEVLQQSPPREFKNQEEYPVMVDRASSDDGEGADDMSYRVYTIDAVYGVQTTGVSEVPLEEKDKRKQFNEGNGVDENVDIKKLYTRLQALEEDREAMRQAIVSMRTEKAQLVLLQEMAQQLRKEVVPERRIVKKKTSLFTSFSMVVLPMIKWIMSFILWKRKAIRSKYSFGLSNSNVGLLLLLDKSPRMTYWRSITRNTLVSATNHHVSSASIQGKSS